ncbi:hypothetical protein EJB05_54479, partial [Eragrostis curvula]
MPQLIDPHTTLWQKLETIPMTSDQRVLVGEHLFSKENKDGCALNIFCGCPTKRTRNVSGAAVMNNVRNSKQQPQ